MGSVTLNGPVVRSGVHNVILRDAVLHSPVERSISSSDYYTIKIGVREGEYTTWIGTWEQNKQKVQAGTPLSILDSDRLGMRLKEKQNIVVKVDSSGSPSTLSGSRVNFRMAHVGGRYGPARPLVNGGSRVDAPDERVALASIERQINGRLSEWEEPVQLVDSVPTIAAGTFQGRIAYSNDTTLALSAYDGDWIEIDGDAISIGSGFTVTTTDFLLASTGAVGSTKPSSSTLYYVYIGSVEGGGELRLSATAPSSHNGALYLGTGQSESKWRFCGWVYLTALTTFVDTELLRYVVNYYNRLRVRVFTCPDYLDDNAATTHSYNTASWGKANAGSGADVSYIANAEDSVVLQVHMRAEPSGAIEFGCAVGIDGITDVETAAVIKAAASTDRPYLTSMRVHEPSTAAKHTASFLCYVSSGSITIYADNARYGATADPAVTYLIGHLMV